MCSIYFPSEEGLSVHTILTLLINRPRQWPSYEFWRNHCSREIMDIRVELELRSHETALDVEWWGVLVDLVSHRSSYHWQDAVKCFDSADDAVVLRPCGFLYVYVLVVVLSVSNARLCMFQISWTSEARRCRVHSTLTLTTRPATDHSPVRSTTHSKNTGGVH